MSAGAIRPLRGLLRVGAFLGTPSWRQARTSMDFSLRRIAMTLGEKQRLFAKLRGQLILHAYELGYELSFGEAMRSLEEAERLAKAGLGIRNSLHCIRLA